MRTNHTPGVDYVKIIPVVATEHRVLWAGWHDGVAPRWTRFGLPEPSQLVSASLAPRWASPGDDGPAVGCVATVDTLASAPAWPPGAAPAGPAVPPAGITDNLGVLVAPDDAATALVHFVGADGRHR
jgi:hypothetical protein